MVALPAVLVTVSWDAVKLVVLMVPAVRLVIDPVVAVIRVADKLVIELVAFVAQSTPTTTVGPKKPVPEVPFPHWTLFAVCAKAVVTGKVMTKPEPNSKVANMRLTVVGVERGDWLFFDMVAFRGVGCLH